MADESAEPAFLTLPLAAKGALGPGYEVVSDAFQKLPAVLKETLGTMLGEEVDVSKPKVARLSKEQLAAAIDPADLYLVHASFSDGIEGSSLLIAKHDAAEALVELALGAPVEGADEGHARDFMGGFLELSNQIYEKVNLTLSEIKGSTVSTDTFAAYDKESQDLSEMIPDGEALCAEFGVSVADKLEGAIFFLFSASAVEQLAEGDGARSETGAPGPDSEPVGAADADGEERLNLILDMEMPVHVRFGETQMQIKDVLQLGAGSVIELNKSVDTPVELVVNEDLVIARGEVVVIESNFAIRITDVRSKAYRIKGLG
ncbi:MAG: FliM/FliN family flagellar motor switch protein [Candidatus Coatesbacteria bacterium]|nr:FliM/FliN family flagellar motor switch protein [Candidatus Coatesbacteria bacterium]